MKCWSRFPQHSYNTVHLCRKRWNLSSTRNNLLSKVSRATVGLTPTRWRKSRKGPAFLKNNTWTVSLLMGAFTVCGFMEMWSELLINVWPMYSWHPSPLSQWWLGARAAERLNYKSHLTWKWTLLSSVPEETANFAYFCCLFLLYLMNTQISFADHKTPSPFFLFWPYHPKEAGLAGLLINLQSPSLEALLSYWAAALGEV